MPRLTDLLRKLLPQQRLPRDVLVLGLIAFFVMVGFGVVIPVLPVYVRSFDVGYLEVGAVVSAFAVMRLLVTPFVGRLTDRGGERTILAIGIGIVAISSGLVGLAQSYEQVLLLRGAGGIGSAMFSVSAMTLLLGSASASSDLSGEVFKYWKVNTDLAVVFGDDNIAVVEPSTGQPVNHRILKIELRDARHGDVETNFSTRSTGFQWFFSFFAAFSEYQHSGEPVIVLLDEPGTSLHGEAQKDFIDYIFKELGASKQTIYSTHSQFMVDPKVYEKLRAVHDRATRADKDQGVAVTHVNLSADRDTILPVESALGYSISQHLFLGSGLHLLVEGSSDFVYLMRMSAYMESNGKTPLSSKLALIPVGGVDNMPAFVALMGRRLGVSVLVDGAQTAKIVDRTKKAAVNNGIAEDKVVTVSEIDKALPATADIEDLFTPKDYLLLYNWAYPDKPILEAQLPATDQPIIKKIMDTRGAEYDHALPAHALTDHQAEFFAQLDKVSIERFEKAFVRLNKTAV